MGRLECCRICLITDVKMERIEGPLENNIKSVFGHNVLYSSDLPDYACYECAALIVKFSKFKKKYLTAQSLLFNILQNHFVVTEREIKSLDRKASHLCSNLSLTNIDNHLCFMDIKKEPDPMEDVPDMVAEEDSGSDDDMPLHSIRNDDNSYEKSNDSKRFLRVRNISAPEIELEEPSIKTKKLNASDVKKESMLKDFVMTKLTRKIEINVPDNKSRIIKKRISYEQRQLMLEYMLAHPNIAAGRPLGPDGARVRQTLLQELAEILNSVDSGCTKTPEKWLKSWQNWRVDVKAKAIAIKLGQNKPGSDQHAPLSPIEEQLAQFMGLEAFDGIDAPDPLLYQTERKIEINVPDNKSRIIKKRISYEQRQLMLEYMLAHPNIAAGRPLGPVGARVRQTLLQELAEILNSVDSGCTKTPEKWLKSWQNWRVDVKAKAIAIKLGQNKPGSDQHAPLSPIEEQLAQFMGLEAFDGIDAPDPLLYQTELDQDQNITVQPVGEEIWISAPAQQETPQPAAPAAVEPAPSPGEPVCEQSKEQPQKRKRNHTTAFTDDPLLPHMKMQAEAMHQQAEAMHQQADAMQRIAGALESIAMAFNRWSAGVSFNSRGEE